MKLRFRHDMLHCRTERCRIKEACMRYLAWQEIKNTEMADKVLVNPILKGGNPINNCKEFIFSEER